MMQALLWKDWRLVRPLLILTAVLYLLPTVIALITVLVDGSKWPESFDEFAKATLALLVSGFFATLLAMPAYTGIMFAKERRERTCDLTASMPVPRSKIVLSKAIIALVLAVIPALFTLLSMCAVGFASDQLHPSEIDANQLHVVVVIACSSLMALGLGWMFSSFLRSDVLSAGLSLLLAVVFLMVIYEVTSRAMGTSRDTPWLPYEAIPIGIAIVSSMVGTTHAMRRRSP